MSTETTNKKIKIDNGTTFGRTYTDKAVDELLKNASGKLDTVKVTYDLNNSKFTADVTNKPDGTYIGDFVIKDDSGEELNIGTKIGLLEIGSLVDMDSGFTFRTLAGYGYLNNLMSFYGIASITDTTIDIEGGTLAYIPTSYTIDGLVKIKSDGTFGSVRVPDQEQSDSFLVYDRTVGNYDWRPVSEIDNKTISLFGKHRILVPKDSADTGILSCNASDNGKVLSVVNGEAQWASAGGGGTEIKSTNIYFGYKQKMKDWEVGDADYLDSELVQILPVNTKTVCYLPYNASQVIKPYGSRTATLLITHASTSESSGYVKGRINIVCLKAGKSDIDLSLTQKRLYTE